MASRKTKTDEPLRISPKTGEPVRPYKRRKGAARPGRPRVPVALRKARRSNISRAPVATPPVPASPSLSSPAGIGGARPPQKDYVAIAEQYARDLIAGKIVACKHARLACERHFKDLDRAKKDPKGFPYYFDPAAANKFCADAERYPHIKGRWAQKGQFIVLAPWQCFALVVPFGWKRLDNHKRRFREMDIFVPRKNGKSTIAAVVGNNMLCSDGEHGAEVYAGATSEKQAWEVFGPARLMMNRSPTLKSEFGIEIWAKAIVRPSDNSKFWPIIGNPGDGASPSCAIVDEYHEHPSSNLVDTMVTGMGSREQPMLLIITTAGTNLASPCYDKYLEAKKVLEGLIENEEMFAVIHGIDEDDDWTSPDAIKKANPNLGISADEGFLLQQQRQAMQNPAYQNRFKTKHLDVWCAASVAGINMHSWRQCANPKMTMEDFRGQGAWFALDLASKTDVCCFAQVFTKRIKDALHYYAFCKHYLPEDTINEATTNQQSYRKWVTMQRLIATPGAEIDFDLIRDDVMAYASRFVAQEVVYDPWRATQLAHQLQKDGAKTVEMGQTAKNMGEAFDEFTSAIKGGRFHHDGDPVLEWMASNVVTKTVAKGLTLPSKEKREQKIDGIVAIVMALARAMHGDSMGAVMGFFSNPVSG